MTQTAIRVARSYLVREDPELIIVPLVAVDDSCNSDRMTLPYDRDALRGRVAVVAGATRGAGRGIAAALAKQARLSSAPGEPA